VVLNLRPAGRVPFLCEKRETRTKRQEPRDKKQETRIKNQESRTKNQEPRKNNTIFRFRKWDFRTGRREKREI
jgi:hypothetical protein